MHHRSVTGALIIFGLALIGVSVIGLLMIQPAAAQCGSMASSCKSCHETQGQDPVNADGTAWHEDHALGDFCAMCHAGNTQATEAEAAHAGMVAPMADIQASCATCHRKNLEELAGVYTVALGIPPAAPGTQAAAASPAPASATTAPDVPDAAAAPPAATMAANDPNLVDYVDRYNQEVLNQGPTNWGNVILIAMLVLLLAVGVFFINRREGWISVSFTEKKSPGRQYSEEVIGIAERAEKLSAAGRKSLARLLGRPAAATELLAALDRLSTDESSGDKHE